MTLDVRIGKIIIEKMEGVAEYDVEGCPKVDYNICDPKYTAWPRDSYRSGSSAFWNFWEKYAGELYFKFRPKYPDTNDKEIAGLKPHIEAIRALRIEDCKDEIDKDRMKWFKFWAERAVQLYGDDAGIIFC